MSDAMKENSALELYETAYRLHYSEGNIPEACRRYKALIDEFPNSNECGYAVIQLQKILANDLSGRINTEKMSKGTMLFAAVAALAFLLLFIFSFAAQKRTKTQIEAVSLVSQALSIMYGGNDNDALDLLNKAKNLSHGKLMDPYLLSATIYMNMQHYTRARTEFELYQKISGKTDTLFRKLVTFRSEKEKIERPLEPKTDSLIQNPPAAVSLPEGSQASAPPKSERSSVQQQGSKSKTRAERAERGRSTGHPSKRPSGNQDSISFF
jgi:tetratricopeptide (TPR) repeat protein